MRAVLRERYGSPDAVTVADVATPIPRPTELFVRVRAASLNTADLDFLTGYPAAARLAFGVIRPRNPIMGADFAGTVESVGAEVTTFRVGDEVWGDLSGSGYGSLTEFVCVREKVVAKKPAGPTFEQAAAVPHSAVLAWQGLTAGRRIEAGQHVLINGAGGCVGPWAVQLAKFFGAEVTAVDESAKLDWIRSIGADHVVDYARENVTHNGRRYDYILDIAANRSVLRYGQSLTPGGRYVLVARNLTGFVLTLVVGSAITMISRKRMGNFLSSPSRRSDMDTLGALLASKQIEAIIDSACDLDGVPDALRRMAAGHARGKIVVTLP